MKLTFRVVYLFAFVLLPFFFLQGSAGPNPTKQLEHQRKAANAEKLNSGTTPAPVKKITKASKLRNNRNDETVQDYQTQRTCWLNEKCKEEFSSKFRCRCPIWTFCSGIGRYYNAYCNLSGNGYMWSQPRSSAMGSIFNSRSYMRRNT